MLKSDYEEEEFENSINVVILKVRDEKYLIEVEYVKEIYVPGENIVPIPLTDKSIVGVIDIRGVVYSIISLRHNIYSGNSEYGLTDHSRILLLEYQDLNIAILVDAVIGVQDIPSSMFKKQGTIVKTNIDFKLIKLTGMFQDESIIILDLDALIQPYIKSQGFRVEKKLGSKPKVLEKPKVQPKLVPKSDVESTLIIPQEIKPQKAEVKKPKAKTGRKKKVEEKKKGERKLLLSDSQQDTLKEIGNIGTGNAVTALSRLIKKKIDVTLTDVGIISLEDLPGQFGGPTEKVCGIFCHIDKPSQATILNIFEMKPLMNLIADLAGDKSKIDPNKVKSKKDLDDFAISTITEMGNIMAGHYASALADLLETRLMIDIPEFTMSQAGEIGEFLKHELKAAAEFFILIKTSIKIADLKLNGMFFFIPDISTLSDFFQKLGIEQKIEEFKEPVAKAKKPAPKPAAKAKKSAPKPPAKAKKSTPKPSPKPDIAPKPVEKPKKASKITEISQVNLTEIQRDALQEVGNIGAGNAANALAQMINKRVDINIPSVEMVELDEFANAISKRNEKLLVAWSNVIGKTRATVLSLFNIKDAIDITSIIVDDPDKNQIDLRKKINNASDFPELYKSALSELGHILGSHYVSAIGDLLGLRLMTEPPDMSVDTGSSLFSRKLVYLKNSHW